MKQRLKDSEKFKYMIYHKIKHCHNYTRVFTVYQAITCLFAEFQQE